MASRIRFFKELQLELVKHKCRYYLITDSPHDQKRSIPDNEYDELERRYLKMVEKYGYKDKLIVGFPTKPKTFLYRLALLQVTLERVEDKIINEKTYNT